MSGALGGQGLHMVCLWESDEDDGLGGLVCSVPDLPELGQHCDNGEVSGLDLEFSFFLILAALREDVRREWEEVKQHDVMFLLTLRPPDAYAQSAAAESGAGDGGTGELGG